MQVLTDNHTCRQTDSLSETIKVPETPPKSLFQSKFSYRISVVNARFLTYLEVSAEWDVAELALVELPFRRMGPGSVQIVLLIRTLGRTRRKLIS